MAASFPSVTVLISPEVVFTGMNSVNYLIRKYLVWSVNYLIREYLVWFLKVAGVGTGNIFRRRTMAASFPSVTVLISPEVVFTGMNSVNYLIREYLVWSVNYLIREYLICFLKVAGVDTGNIYRWRTMAASFPSVTVLISPEVLFTGMKSVNYLIREYLVWFLKVGGVDTGNIYRWRTMAASFPSVTVL